MHIFKLEMDEPQKFPNNVYEVIAHLPQRLDQVLQGEIPAKEITILCSKEMEKNIKENLEIENPNVKFNYYGDAVHWPFTRTKYCLFTTPYVNFEELCDRNSHIHENNSVFKKNEDAKNLLGNSIEAYNFEFINEHLNKKLMVLRDKRLVEALIWYKQLRKKPDEITHSTQMKLMTQVNLYPFIQLSPATGQYVINQDAIDELGEEDVLILPNRKIR